MKEINKSRKQITGTRNQNKRASARGMQVISRPLAPPVHDVDATLGKERMVCWDKERRNNLPFSDKQ